MFDARHSRQDPGLDAQRPKRRVTVATKPLTRYFSTVGLAESGFGGLEPARVVAAQLKELRRFHFHGTGARSGSASRARMTTSAAAEGLATMGKGDGRLARRAPTKQ